MLAGEEVSIVIEDVPIGMLDLSILPESFLFTPLHENTVGYVAEDNHLPGRNPYRTLGKLHSTPEFFHLGIRRDNLRETGGTGRAQSGPQSHDTKHYDFHNGILNRENAC